MRVCSRLYLYRKNGRLILPHEIHLGIGAFLVTRPKILFIAVVAIQDNTKFLRYNLFCRMTFPNIKQRIVL